CEPTTGCRTSGMLGQNVRQRLGELAIKCRNVRAVTHDLSQIYCRDPSASTVMVPRRSLSGKLKGAPASIQDAEDQARKGWDQPALTAIFFSTLRASAVFGRVTD